MSKTILELHTDYADARDEILKKLDLEGDHADRIHIVDRTKVKWVYSAARGTLWVSTSMPPWDTPRENLVAWMEQATYFGLMRDSQKNTPALWEIDGVTAVLFAWRHGGDIVVLMFLDPALRAPDSLGDRIHEIAEAEENAKPCVAVVTLDPGTPKKPDVLH